MEIWSVLFSDTENALASEEQKPSALNDIFLALERKNTQNNNNVEWCDWFLAASSHGPNWARIHSVCSGSMGLH